MFMLKAFQNPTLLKLLLTVILAMPLGFQGQTTVKPAHNPIIWADVPDLSMIRVGDTYYMSSTTMHMNPGVPIMASKNLINWQLINYAYDTLAINDALQLQNGTQAYGKGSWASCLRYHNGTYYVSTFSSTSGKTHIYTTTNIEKGPWTEHSFEPSYHDHSLFFDEDGSLYIIWGAGKLYIAEVKKDLSGIKEGSKHVLIENASAPSGDNIMLKAEGSQLFKVNNMYYLFNISWPRNGMRTVIVHRSNNIKGPYEGKVVLQDRGIAQGGLIDTPNGDWHAYLFRDYGAVGRIPYLAPVTWKEGWPVIGHEGKVPDTLAIKAAPQTMEGIVTSDEFNENTPNKKLPLEWQWNHNPDNNYWSLTERPGHLRLTNGRLDNSFLDTRNTLTQRTFGPECSASIKLDISHLNNGDYAGLAALQKQYAYVGVKKTNGKHSLIMVNGSADDPIEEASIPLNQKEVYLKVSMDFRNKTDKAYFYFSLNGTDWKPIGNSLQMAYTLPHFMGYRFAIFSYATQTTGGFVDIDWFRLEGPTLD
ncbi:glycoside hydrolase 43 family protein [Mangrovimonas sp. YM274]|uniref:glycoside hydrolase family 43 protein n=1 Tax=Mangrovimonas sp. YM274 TaxID=3070660 RepID=UPI0027DB485D|nr:glycoside hydrolase 43 family protein [Mangrovimonas sp. YM274]WMI69023.1 glycoside hydrolase 43 family protein [Mangrovimonas sp. YM274]